MTIHFNELVEFSKECKQLAKKYRSLPEDLTEFKKIVTALPCGTGKHFNILTQTATVKILKARLFCRYLKGSSLRVIYAYHQTKSLIEFMEIYFKGEKESEDKGRIKKYLAGF